MAGDLLVLDWRGHGGHGATFVIEKIFFASEFHGPLNSINGLPHGKANSAANGGSFDYSTFALGKPPKSAWSASAKASPETGSKDSSGTEPALRFRGKGPAPTNVPRILCTLDGTVKISPPPTSTAAADGDKKNGAIDDQVSKLQVADQSHEKQGAVKSGPNGTTSDEDWQPLLQESHPSLKGDENSLKGAAPIVVCIAALVTVLWCWLRIRAAGGGLNEARVIDTPGNGSNRGHRSGGESKSVTIVAADGSQHSASLSLDGLDDVAEVMEALAELVGEVLEDDTLISEDLKVELRDALGRKRLMATDMPMSAVLRAHSMHASSIRFRHSRSTRGS